MPFVLGAKIGMPRVSVIIPTYNRVERLKQVLAAFAVQDFPLDQFEVIVVSDGSSDGTHEYLQALDSPLQLSLIIQENQGPAAARNRGVQAAHGDLVLFTDDDVVPCPRLIAEHVRVHDESGPDVVVLGPMLTPDDFAMSAWVRWEQAMLAKQYAQMNAGAWNATARQFYTGNTSLLRRHLNAVGGFDVTFRRAEDVELAYRLIDRGVTFIFNPSGIGYHYAERSFRSWMETPYIYGRNEVIFTRDKQQQWLLPCILEEFHHRNPLVQLLVRLCLDRKKLSDSALAGLMLIAHQSDRLGVEKLVKFTYSGIFNLRYYQGIADELGGRKLFFTQVQ
jgi:GT2 family glycosyltransferase